MVVAQAARDRRASRQILLDEGLHHIALKAVLVIDDVIRNTERLSYTARVVNIIERAAAPVDGFRHSGVSCQTALVP